jgi:hypothetical protein
MAVSQKTFYSIHTCLFFSSFSNYMKQVLVYQMALSNDSSLGSRQIFQFFRCVAFKGLQPIFPSLASVNFTVLRMQYLMPLPPRTFNGVYIGILTIIL